MRKLLFLLFTSLFFSAAACSQQFDPQAEQQLVQELNQERARAGLPSLQVDDRLTRAARAHTAGMAKKNLLTHDLPGEPTLPKRLAATGLRFNNDAENVAFNSDINRVHQGFMNSPGHRANILSPNYNTVGIGVLQSGDVYWVTEDFAHRLEDYSVNEAEDTMIADWVRERQRARAPRAPAARSAQLRKMACEMAKRGRLDTRRAFNQPDPKELPSSAVKAAHDSTIRKMALGACFAAGPGNPAGAWWVVMAFY
jgi:hypothetical protein